MDANTINPHLEIALARVKDEGCENPAASVAQFGSALTGSGGKHNEHLAIALQRIDAEAGTMDPEAVVGRFNSAF